MVNKKIWQKPEIESIETKYSQNGSKPLIAFTEQTIITGYTPMGAPILQTAVS